MRRLGVDGLIGEGRGCGTDVEVALISIGLVNRKFVDPVTSTVSRRIVFWVPSLRWRRLCLLENIWKKPDWITRHRIAPVSGFRIIYIPRLQMGPNIEIPGDIFREIDNRWMLRTRNCMITDPPGLTVDVVRSRGLSLCKSTSAANHARAMRRIRHAVSPEGINRESTTHIRESDDGESERWCRRVDSEMPN